MRKLPFALSLYRGAVRAAAPLARAYLSHRARRGKEDAARLEERFGVSPLPRPPGPLVWLHGASVGEMGVALTLRAALAQARADLSFLITTGTLASAQMLAARMPPHTRHQFAPMDTEEATVAFLNHWRPDLGVFAESEIWPNLLLAARARGTKLALVNARMSAQSLANWARLPHSAGSLFGAFALVLAADQITADGVQKLGAAQARLVGNLKASAPPLPVDGAQLQALRGHVGLRPLWLAASTHAGEEALVLAAHKTLLQAHPDALLILAPRHPDRFNAVAELCGQFFGAAPRRSAGTAPNDGPIYLADTMGELGLFYSLAPVAFVGGSLLPTLRGHNPIEPAQAGAAILSGPHVTSFADSFETLKANGGCRIVTNIDELAGAVRALWADEIARQAMTTKARETAAQSAQTLTETVAALTTLLPEAAHARA